jgi:hypothetical protein
MELTHDYVQWLVLVLEVLDLQVLQGQRLLVNGKDSDTSASRSW